MAPTFSSFALYVSALSCATAGKPASASSSARCSGLKAENASGSFAARVPRIASTLAQTSRVKAFSASKSSRFGRRENSARTAAGDSGTVMERGSVVSSPGPSTVFPNGDFPEESTLGAERLAAHARVEVRESQMERLAQCSGVPS